MVLTMRDPSPEIVTETLIKLCSLEYPSGHAVVHVPMQAKYEHENEINPGLRFTLRYSSEQGLYLPGVGDWKRRASEWRAAETLAVVLPKRPEHVTYTSMGDQGSFSALVPHLTEYRGLMEPVPDIRLGVADVSSSALDILHGMTYIGSSEGTVLELRLDQLVSERSIEVKRWFEGLTQE